jgi:hypothetical protein
LTRIANDHERYFDIAIPEEAVYGFKSRALLVPVEEIGRYRWHIQRQVCTCEIYLAHVESDLLGRQLVELRVGAR